MWRLVVAWLLSSGPVAIQLVRLHYSDALAPAMAAAMLAVLVITWAVPRVQVLAIGMAAAGTTAYLLDPAIRPWTIAVVVGFPVLWAVAMSALFPARTRPLAQLLEGALVPLGVGAVSMSFFSGLIPPIICMALATAAMATNAVAARRPTPASTEPIGRARRLLALNWRILNRVGTVFGSILGGLAMIPAAIVILVVWSTQRLFRVDPLAAPVTGETRWVRRAGLDADPLRGFGTVAVADPRGWSATTRRLLAAALPPLVIGLLVVGLTRSPDTVTSAPRSGATTGGLAGTDNATASVTPDDDCSKFELDDPDPVMDGQPGWPELALSQPSVHRATGLRRVHHVHLSRVHLGLPQ